MNKTITRILMISAYVIFIASFTICAIEIVFPNITIALSSIALPFALITSIVIMAGTLDFLNEPFMKEKKHIKGNRIAFTFTTVYFVISNAVLLLFVFIYLISSGPRIMWRRKNKLELGFDANHLVSGNLYIGDIINKTDIEIEFSGKVNLDEEEYLYFDNTKVKSLKINGEEIEIPDRYTRIDYQGICDYELKATFDVGYSNADGYRGFRLTNPYNENVKITLSSNYMINVGDDIYDYTLLICDAGTPYQYRYNKLEMGLRWVLFIEYIITTPLFIYFGIYYSINSIKQLKKKEF